MTLKDLAKSIFLNMSEPNYGYADWSTRRGFIISLRELSKQAKRILELGAEVINVLEESLKSEINGIIFALDISAELFETYLNPIYVVREHLKEQILDFGSKIEDIRQTIGFESDIFYYSAIIKTLNQIYQETSNMEDEDNHIRNTEISQQLFLINEQ